ncbi:MAG: GNAT family N-acetyltransferase [Chloroflexi bacterium]|nr:GNAT family N-acetyltransferase [Chloroflexota bacterium]
MSVVIRRATPHDAVAIAAIVLEAFGERINEESGRVARVLRQSDNFVAESDDRVVGFVGNFLTRSGSGRLRFELDLLAVAQDARGGGIGAVLVDASIEAAASAKVDVIRTLVASRNAAMQRLCRSRGFRRDPTRHVLFVTDAQVWGGADMEATESLEGVVTGEASNTSEAYLIPVETLTYSGIWLEGGIRKSAIDEARRLAYDGGMSRIGAVLPQSDEGAVKLLATNRFDRVGEFDWWTIKTGSGRS